MAKEHERFKIGQWGAFIKDGKCLILKAAGKEMWELPGGRIDKDELIEKTPTDAFRREISEELGIKNFEILEQVGWMIGVTNHDHVPICRVVYLITSESSEIKLSFEHEEFKWIGKSEIDNFKYNNLKNATPLSEILIKAFKLYENRI